MPGGRSGKNALQSILSAGNRAWKSAFPGKQPKFHRRSRMEQPQPKLITYKGNVYVRRLKLKHRPPRSPNIIPKLPIAGPAVMPLPLQKAPSLAGTTSDSVGTVVSKQNSENTGNFDWSQRLSVWLRRNGPVLILNFGSVCTLFGFTRQDVLELRFLSMTGSTAFVIYQFFQHPRLWLSIAWSSMFASVNAYKIVGILNERKANVVLTEHEQTVFVEHFMPHGVTPKQFETIMKKSRTVHFQKGEMIVKRGEKVSTLYLVVKGDTRGSILGRRLTAISSHPGALSRKGGDSGAWIGEMAFLSYFGGKESERMQNLKNRESKSSNKEKTSKVLDPQNHTDDTVTKTLYTIMAAEDTELLAWSFDDLESMMHKSTDLRASMTRAMTAPIVGKVINFTVSRSTGKQSWTEWLNDWKYSGGNVTTTRENESEENNTVDVAEENEIDPKKNVIPSTR